MTSASTSPDATHLAAEAAEVLRLAGEREIKLATAESCTGGLLSSLLTDIEGCSGAFERGFATYSNEAKSELLGVEPLTIAVHGAVSREAALEMAEGALERSHGQVAVAITGFAGPGGKRDEEGLVHVAALSERGHRIHRECHFGPRGRDAIRLLAAQAALEVMHEVLADWPDPTR